MISVKLTRGFEQNDLPQEIGSVLSVDGSLLSCEPDAHICITQDYSKDNLQNDSIAKEMGNAQKDVYIFSNIRSTSCCKLEMILYDDVLDPETQGKDCSTCTTCKRTLIAENKTVV